VAGAALRSYVRWRLFNPDQPPPRQRAKVPVKDPWALGELASEARWGPTRIDNFLNQYALWRNVLLSSFLAAAALIQMAYRTGSHQDATLAIGAAVLAFGLFARFVKFYAASTREVFRGVRKAVA